MLRRLSFLSLGIRNLNTKMAWRSHGRDNDDLVSQLKSESSFFDSVFFS